MMTIITVVACLKAAPLVCQSFPAVLSHEDGSPVTFYECLGVGGQEYLRRFTEEHPDMIPQKLRCTITNDPSKAMGLLEDVPA